MHREASTNASTDPTRTIGKGAIGIGLVVLLLLVPLAAQAAHDPATDDTVAMTCIHLGDHEITLYGVYSWTWRTTATIGLHGQATQTVSLTQCAYDLPCKTDSGIVNTVGHYEIERKTIAVSDEQSRLDAVVAPLNMEWSYTCQDGHLKHTAAYEAAKRFHDFDGCANGQVLEQPISGRLVIDTQRSTDFDHSERPVLDTVKLHGHRLSLDPALGCEDVNGVYAPRLDGVGPRVHIR